MVKKRPLGAFIKLIIALWALISPPAVFAQVRTEMKVFSDSFISPDFEATQKTSYQFVGAQLKTDSLAQTPLKMNIYGGVAVGAPLLNYLNISEFYVQTHQNQEESFFIGRKMSQWNELDARWDLGVWEPLFKWNPLSPERQGLTGLFWQIEKPRYSMMLFASPFYVPDQGPSFEIENGSFVKGNPWFRRPPESIRIWSQATQIDYRFQRPEESQIVLQNSFGGRLAFGDTKQGLRTQLSYAYKPMNQLSLGYQGSLDMGQLKGVVDLQPQVIYHSLAGADLTYKTNSLTLGVSGMWDRPMKEAGFTEEWTYSVFSDAVLVSPFVEFRQSAWGLTLQHLDIFGGKITEKGELADPARVPLMSRYPYQQADQLSVLTNFNLGKSRRLQTKVSYLYSAKNEFELIRMQARLRISAMWSFISEAQLVKAESLSAENQNEIAQFVNNDRLMVGAAYVF